MPGLWSGGRAMTSPSPEMIEKARACAQEAYKRQMKENRGMVTVPYWTPTTVASFAESAVRDAVSELIKYAVHLKDCLICISPAEAHAQCTCGLAALRQKYGVQE